MAKYSVTSGGSSLEVEAERAELLTDRNQVILYDKDDEVVGSFFGASFYKVAEEEKK